MLDLEQVVTLVPPIVRVDDDVARSGRDAAGGFEHELERDARPLADRRPPLLTHVCGDLRASRHALELFERQLDWSRDEATDRQFPVLEIFSRVLLILLTLGIDLVPRRERIGNVRTRILARQLLP